MIARWLVIKLVFDSHLNMKSNEVGVVSTAAFHGVRFPVYTVRKKQKCFFPIHS